MAPIMTPYRRGLIASVKIAQKDMGLDDETYRAMLSSVCGKDSAAKCSNGELVAVLAEMKRAGWQPKPRVANPLTPLRKKIAALCAALGKPKEYADGILARQTASSATVGTADRKQLTACVAALVRQQARQQAQEERI